MPKCKTGVRRHQAQAVLYVRRIHKSVKMEFERGDKVGEAKIIWLNLYLKVQYAIGRVERVGNEASYYY